MRVSRAPEAGASTTLLRASRALRRARAALRLHGEILVAVLLGAGIVLMALHWR